MHHAGFREHSTHVRALERLLRSDGPRSSAPKPDGPDAAHRSETDRLRRRCATNRDERHETGTSPHRCVGRSDGDPPLHDRQAGSAALRLLHRFRTGSGGRRCLHLGCLGPTTPRQRRDAGDGSERRRGRHPDVRESQDRCLNCLQIVAKPDEGRPGVRRRIAALLDVGPMGAGHRRCSSVRPRSHRRAEQAHLPLDDHRQRRNGTKSEQGDDDHQMAA